MSLFDRIKNLLKKTKDAFVNFFTGKSRKESKKKKTGIPPKSSPTADPKSTVHKMNAKATHRQEKKARRDAKKKAKADAAKAAKEASREAHKAEKEKRKREKKEAKDDKQQKRKISKTKAPSSNAKAIPFEDMSKNRYTKELIELLEECYRRDRESLEAVDAYHVELGYNTQGMLDLFDTRVLELLYKVRNGEYTNWDPIGDEYYSIKHNEIEAFYLNGDDLSAAIYKIETTHHIKIHKETKK